jgi:hypothetical protein
VTPGAAASRGGGAGTKRGRKNMQTSKQQLIDALASRKEVEMADEPNLSLSTIPHPTRLISPIFGSINHSSKAPE